VNTLRFRSVNAEGQSSLKWPWPFDTAALITLLSVALTVIKLMAVAGGDPETAYAILQTQGTATVIIGALLTSIGLILAPIGVALMVTYYKAPSDSRRIVFPVAAFAITFIVITITPWFELVSVIIFSLLLLSLVGFLLPSPKGEDSSLRGRWKATLKKVRNDWLRTSIVLYGAAVLLVGIANQTPWLPTEKISLHGNLSITGYVLARDQYDVSILNYTTLSIDNFSSQQITIINLCRPSDYWKERTILELMYLPSYAPPGYPPCPNVPSRSSLHH
jgi:hypothetical protein